LTPSGHPHQGESQTLTPSEHWHQGESTTLAPCGHRYLRKTRIVISVSQAASQPVIQSVGQPSASRPISQPGSQPTNQPASCQSASQSASQPVKTLGCHLRSSPRANLDSKPLDATSGRVQGQTCIQNPWMPPQVESKGKLGLKTLGCHLRSVQGQTWTAPWGTMGRSRGTWEQKKGDLTPTELQPTYSVQLPLYASSFLGTCGMQELGPWCGEAQRHPFMNTL